jgi:uncharacterized membrane protein YphA (DoxX/SURF4 family)
MEAVLVRLLFWLAIGSSVTAAVLLVLGAFDRFIFGD